MFNLMFTMLYMVETTERDSLRHILVPAPSGADAVHQSLLEQTRIALASPF